MLPAEKLPDCRLLILEGSYCNLPAIRQYADLRLFMNTPWEIRKERLEKRESAPYLQMFFDRWIPLENHYFEAYGLPDRECIVLYG
jgi:uridine kinase